MKLYHFTSWHNYRDIVQAGEIRVTESHIGSDDPEWPPFGEHVGPDVVWLTTREHPALNGVEVPLADLDELSESCGAPAIELDKTQVRLTIDVPGEEAHRWSAWSKRYGAHPKWRRALRVDRAPRFWYVIERPVRTDEITGAVSYKALSAHLGAGAPDAGDESDPLTPE